MFTIEKTSDGVFGLRGDLTLSELRKAEHALRDLGEQNQTLILDGAGLQKLDTAGAFALAEFQSHYPDARLKGLSADHASLLALIGKSIPPDMPAPAKQNILVQYVEKIGRVSISAARESLSTLAFFGQVVVYLCKGLRRPSRFRIDSITRHMQETGIDAMPIIALVAFLISVVLAYQGAFQLRPYGAQFFTINLVAISVLREMAVLLTAIMIAGRSGSAFTAEIGVMKVNEEVDALSMIGIDPFDILVMPRILALLVTLPLLTFMADVVGLFGGGVMCFFALDISWTQYWDQIQRVAQGTDFMVGMLKAPVFALIISIVGCRLGMQVSGSAESVGAYTTRSVVESIFIVLVADAFFSVFFTKIGW